jgi:GGDEF domain-containing protein/putative methionine-R-sulfoxide reductase with GAF domain
LTSDENKINENYGEQFFDAVDDDNPDDKFRNSVKNLLVLIKDFYSADYTVVYWYNKVKNSFKLLADSEPFEAGIHKEKFSAGNDVMASAATSQKPSLLSSISPENVSHLNNTSVKSIMVNPVIVDGEVIAAAVCESKTEDFFGEPNLKTLEVFSEYIKSLISYYSLKEEFDFEDGLLMMLASGKFSDEQLFAFVNLVAERYVDTEDYYVVICDDELIKRSSFIKKTDRGLEITEMDIEEGSILHNAIKTRKIINRFFRYGEDKIYRCSREEEQIYNVNFCCIPFSAGKNCCGVIAFNTKDDMPVIQSSVKSIYKLVYPVVLYLNLIHSTGFSGTKQEEKFKNKKRLLARLNNELIRCRQFDDTNIYLVSAGIDNVESVLKPGYNLEDLEDILHENFAPELSGYDQIYKVDDNRFVVLLCSGNEDNVHIQFEKIRKKLSVIIHNIEGKEVTFTVSFAIKRYLDLNSSPDEILNELDEMLKLSEHEGGNQVKI